MISKVLIADDSLTIQKVISITLANSGYELVECLNEEDLVKKVESNEFDLILLDFNLSDSKSGYELSKLIKSKLPKSSIIVMLGTFDTVDEGQFAACGINDKIVKPFESSKFIKKCKDVLEGTSEEMSEDFSSTSTIDSNEVEDEFEDSTSNELDLDGWTMESPHGASTEVLEDFESDDDELEDLIEHELEEDIVDLDPLASEMKGWGFQAEECTSLEDTFSKSFPPVIEEKNNSILERLESSSNFEMSDDDFFADDDETNPTIDYSSIMTQSIENEIEEDLTAEDFWAVDEVLELESLEKDSIHDNNIEEVTSDLTEKMRLFQESANEPLELAAAVVTPSPIIDEAMIVERLKSSIRPMIEEMVKEMVKEYCSKQAERVAWEIIPDLAENLIREEIRSLSNSVKL